MKKISIDFLIFTEVFFKLLDGWTYKNRNDVFYHPTGVQLSDSEKIELAKKDFDNVTNNSPSASFNETCQALASASPNSPEWVHDTLLSGMNTNHEAPNFFEWIDLNNDCVITREGIHI